MGYHELLARPSPPHVVGLTTTPPLITLTNTNTITITTTGRTPKEHLGPPQGPGAGIFNLNVIVPTATTSISPVELNGKDPTTIIGGMR